MSPKESERLIAEIRVWCDLEYGRRAELARTLGVSRQLVSEWFAGRREISLEKWLVIQKIMRRKSKPKAEKLSKPSKRPKK